MRRWRRGWGAGVATIANLAVMISANTVNLVSGLAGAERSLLGFGSQLGRITQQVSGMQLLGGSFLLGAAAVGVNAAAQAESAEASFTQLLGSGDQAQTMLQQLRQFAATTPFELPTVRAGAQQLLNYGFAAEDALGMLRIVGDAAAMSPDGMEQGLERVIRALGQMRGRGKVSAQEMLQLTEAGIASWHMLAEGMGVTVAEAQERVTQGTVSAATGIASILYGIQTKFGGQMQKQSETLVGLWSNLKDSVTMALGEIATLAMPILKWLTKSVAWVFDRAASGARMVQNLFSGRWALHDPVPAGQVGDQSAATIARVQQAAAQEAQAQSTRELAASVADLEAKLREEARTFGQSAAAQQEYALKAKGATDAQLGQVRALNAHLERLREREKLAGRVKELLETPESRLQQQLEELTRAQNAGLLQWDDYNRLYDKAKADHFAGTEAGKLAADVAAAERELRKQAATFGMTAEAARLYDFAQRGATAAQLAQLKALQEQTAALEEQKKVAEEAAQRHERLAESLKTPVEELRERLSELEEALQAGAISRQQYLFGMGKALDLAGGQEQKQGDRFAGVIERGSREAYSALLASRSVGNSKPAERTNELLAQLNGGVAKMVENGERMERALKDRQLALTNLD